MEPEILAVVISLSTVFGITCILCCTKRYSWCTLKLKDSIVIPDTTVETVYNILVDVTRWSEWNKFVSNIECVNPTSKDNERQQMQENLSVIMTVHLGSMTVQANETFRMVTPTELRWQNDDDGFMQQTDRAVLLEQVGSDVHVENGEVFRGPIVPILICLTIASKVEAGFKIMNESLAERVKVLQKIAKGNTSLPADVKRNNLIGES